MDNLWPHLGKITEKYIALELLRINGHYFSKPDEQDYERIRFPPKKPHLPAEEIDTLLSNIHDTLALMVGPTHSRMIVKSLEDELNK